MKEQIVSWGVRAHRAVDGETALEGAEGREAGSAIAMGLDDANEASVGGHIAGDMRGSMFLLMPRARQLEFVEDGVGDSENEFSREGRRQWCRANWSTGPRTHT